MNMENSESDGNKGRIQFQMDKAEFDRLKLEMDQLREENNKLKEEKLLVTKKNVELENGMAMMKSKNDQLRTQCHQKRNERNEINTLKGVLAKTDQLLAMGKKTNQLIEQMAEMGEKITQMRMDCNEFNYAGKTGEEMKWEKGELWQQIGLCYVEFERIEETTRKMMKMLEEMKTGFDAYRKQNAEYLLAVEQAKEGKRQMVEMAKKHNMGEESRPVGNEEDNDQQILLWMPLELHAELFAWLPFQCRLRLVPTLCRGIWAVKGKEVKRKWESLNKWHRLDSSRIEVSNDGRTAKYIQRGFGYYIVRAMNPFPSEISKYTMRRIYYFEVTIVNNCGTIYIGLCDANFTLTPISQWNGYYVGEITHSFGIYSSGWISMEGDWKRNAAYEFGQGDVIGCGMELAGNGRRLFFTKNGKICVEPFPLPLHVNNVELFPAVSMYYTNGEIQANFGHEPFKYNLAQHFHQPIN